MGRGTTALAPDVGASGVGLSRSAKRFRRLRRLRLRVEGLP